MIRELSAGLQSAFSAPHRTTADLVGSQFAAASGDERVVALFGEGVRPGDADLGSTVRVVNMIDLEQHADEQQLVVLDDVGTRVDERAVYRQLFGLLPVGAHLVLVLDEVTGDRSLRNRTSAALFAEGFVGTQMSSTRDSNLVVVAQRGAAEPPRLRTQQLSVVMPVYNERETFRKVVEDLLAKSIEGVEIEVIIVESNSNDGTREEVMAFASHPQVRIVLEDRASGKGHAVRAGFAAARGDFVLIQDADLEYDLDDYAAILEPLRNFETGFVLGARRRTHGARWGVRHFEKEILTSWAMNVGNVAFLWLFNTVYRQHLADPFTMYKAVRRDCLTHLYLECNRFDFDWELTAKLIRSGFQPTEIPVAYHSRSFSEGKKISVLRDPLSWVVACFKYRFARLEA